MFNYPVLIWLFSKGYAFAHFPHKSTNVTLQRPGKSKKWHPILYERKDKRLYMLRGQWSDFVLDNQVQVGDTCLLFPTKGARKFTFTVHLLRATADHPRGGTVFQKVGSYHGRSSTKMAYAVYIKVESTEGENISSESDMHETSYESVEDFGAPSKPPYIVPSKSCLSQSQKIVEEKVRAIQSEVPIFVAIMKKCNVGVTQQGIIELGARFAAPHLPDRGQTVVLQCMGKTWKTKMVIRNGRRWILRGGWPTFVRDNGLRIGDICLFELNKNERKPTMMVHIIFRGQF